MGKPHPDEAVHPGRWMARRGEPFAVFLFGMRLNRARGLARFLWACGCCAGCWPTSRPDPRGASSPRVYRAGRTLIAVQYWESFDALDGYARDHGLPHRPAWQRYLREALNDPAAGLWHETYLAEPGSWEGVYVNMPPWALGAGADLLEMRATRGSARERLHQRGRPGRS